MIQVRASIKPNAKPTSAGSQIRPQGNIKPSSSSSAKPSTAAQKLLPGFKPVITAARPPSNPPPLALKPGTMPVKRLGGPSPTGQKLLAGVKQATAAARPPSTPPPGVLKPGTTREEQPSTIGQKLLSGVKPVLVGAAAVKQSGKSEGTSSNPDKLPAYTVSTNSKKTELGLDTLVGTYTEIGENHDRKCYQKIEAIPDHEEVKVFLYFWDSRDGADSSGWWFGDQLGGTQVWARCVNSALLPPRIGWRVPWHSPTAESGILLVEPHKKPVTPVARLSVEKPSAPAKPAKPIERSTSDNPAIAAFAARVQKATQQVDAAEKDAGQVLEETRSLNCDSPETQLQTMLDSLTTEQTKLNDVRDSLTQEIAEARKAGPAFLIYASSLSDLSKKIRSTLSNVAAELSKINANLTGILQEAEYLKELEESLPVVEESVCCAEDAVEAVHITAQPLIHDVSGEIGEASSGVVQEVEDSAGEAQAKLSDAQRLVAGKLQAALKLHTTAARKKAQVEFSAMHEKLNEAQKKLSPYKNFKKELQQRAQVKKSLNDVSDKTAAAELEVEKVVMMSDAADHGQMTEGELKSQEKLVNIAETGLTNAIKLVDAKIKTATSSLFKVMLSDMKTGLDVSRKKLEGVTTVLKHQREGLVLQHMAAEVVEKVDAVEESLRKCDEAEMPFLKGIEVLPHEESEKAIRESEVASVAAAKMLDTAQICLRSKLAEANGFSKEASGTVMEELNELQQRVDEAATKLQQFKKDTSERKTTAIMSEVLDAVTAAETEGKNLAEALVIFNSENVDELVIDDLKAASEQASIAEKETSIVLTAAKALIAAKMKTATDRDLAQALSKMNGRVQEVQQELTKAKQASSTGDRLIEGKVLLTEETARLEKAEADVEKGEALLRSVEGKKTLSDENLKEMDAAMVSASEALKACQGLVQSKLNAALPSLKPTFQKLLGRCKAALTTIERVKVASKDQRKIAICNMYVHEGRSMAEGIEAAMEETNQAELPFLKGIEVLALEDALAAIKESEEAAAKVQKRIGETRTFLAAKNLEVKSWKETAKDAVQEFAKLTERVNAESGKLSEFRKDTEARKKAARVQEVGEKISMLEAEVEKVSEAAKPLDSPQIKEEDFLEQWKALSTLEKETKTKADEAKNFLTEASRDVRGDEKKTKIVNDLQKRLATATTKIAKAHEVVGIHEQTFRIKVLLLEAAEKMAELDEAVKEATKHCAPLLEDGSERFLVSERKHFIGAALQEQMQEKDVSLEDLITGIGGTSGKVPKDVFINYLANLPETLGREDLALTEERQLAIFEQMDVDKDGHISEDDFREATKKRYTCIHDISVTDVFDVINSKTVAKLEVGEFLEARGLPKTGKPKGMPRLQIKTACGDKQGWVTMAGNAGTRYLEEVSEIDEFCSSCDVKLKETTVVYKRVAGYFTAKAKEVGATGPLSEARSEIAKYHSEAKNALKVLEDMNRKIASRKKDHSIKVEAEANAYIVAREQRQADSMIDAAKAMESEMKAELSKLEEAAAPLISLEICEVLAFPTPVTIRDETIALVESTNKLIEGATTIIKEHQEKVAQATQGPMLQAKKELGNMKATPTKVASGIASVQTAVRKACATIADQGFEKVRASMREDMRRQAVLLDDLWSQLSTPGAEHITEESFCKHIASLEDITMHIEHAQLVSQRLETGGIGQLAFKSFLQQYFIVVSQVAITKTFELVDTKEQPIRRADLDEIFELLEGPVIDEKVGLERVRAKSINDGIVGWLTVKGSQGKVFLKEVEKPFYVCSKELPLQTSYSSSSEVVRTVKVDEALELIEGPRKETFQVALRVRGKASLDDKTGWFTIKDKHGAELARRGAQWVCCATAAMTDKFDVKTCKAVKKLSVGNIFTLVEGPIEDEATGLVRVKGRTCRDNAEGWVTVKGNAGTLYAKVNEKLYCIDADKLPLHNRLASRESSTLRTLARGEALEALEGPKEEKFPAVSRLKCRASGDGAVGWLTVESDAVRKFSGSYRTIKASCLQETRSIGGSMVREMSVGESLELLEGPLEESGVMRMKCRSKKDNATGWVSFRDTDGSKLIQAS